MQILQAGALIKEARAWKDGQNLTLDALREVDLDENQSLLAQGFARRIDRAASLIVLDCHTVIETTGGLVRIDPRVFVPMNVRAMVFLEDEPEEIAQRRRNDATRQRPSTQDLRSVQAEARRQACTITAALNIPLFVHRPAGQDGAIMERLRIYLAPDGA